MILTERFEEALAFAARLHNAQVRKGTGIPYVSHLLAVASIALEHGADEDEAIAALLHDAVEDQGGDTARQEIRRRFGERVAAIVDGCTDAETTPKPPWRERKERYVAHVADAPPSVRLVSAADKLHNARAILADLRATGDAVWGRFKGRHALVLPLARRSLPRARLDAARRRACAHGRRDRATRRRPCVCAACALSPKSHASGRK
jgi:GTP pyrophosphokinase